MKHLIAIVGPTAAGKSNLAINLAQCFGGEIINADSRQVYRHMDIGTSKPTLSERELVPHHLIDVVDPNEDFNLALYYQLATETINAVHTKGKLPLLVGGSGLYVWSVIEGWDIPAVPPNKELRRDLEIKAQGEGRDTLYRELQTIDPLAASKIHPGNIRRIIRALEIYYAVGQYPSKLWRKEAPDFSVLVVGLTMERSELYGKIDQRVDKMIEKGLIEEVKSLMERGYNISVPSMSGIGYKQIGQFLEGEIASSTAIEKIKYETHRLARHQYAWFRLGDARIHWLDASHSCDITSVANNLVKEALSLRKA
ncbi:MAG: tRNA (adenosine(37)-N6)-dimethylallyltransferase MiaA [Chloroflexota bacterium]|nr:tRNA (adenosine(37)-N6)-dimethylallyltransferase MiaA [Chloroflexota bacterium]